MIEVVAAFIRKNDKFLICQRPEHKVLGLLWEFVGGKVETGESNEEALKRECKEELNVEISVGEKIADIVYEYPEFIAHLTLYYASIESGEPELLEHNAIMWINQQEIPEYEFCSADKVILDSIF